MRWENLFGMVLVKNKNRVFKGIGASPGIVIGEARIADRSRVAIVEVTIDNGEIPAEIDRFKKSLLEAKEELKAIKEHISQTKGIEHLYVMDTHLLILEDSMLTNETVNFIANEKINAEAA